ncbi:MAG TPA: hypothetical protein VHI13_10495, partial [Candidatus Kapabacteria bacterium]|nr:hypothetical protein [Candidatus Kapabacteria bacterium]
PFPANTEELVVSLKHKCPAFIKHAKGNPLLEIPMDGCSRAILTWHGLPLTSGSCHIKNAIEDTLEAELWPSRHPRDLRGGRNG